MPILASFGEKNGIAFPMLSDPDSAVIRRYGILNPEGNGFPFPGTFLIDGEGTVRAKLFLDGYRDRHTNAALIEAAGAID